MNPTGWVTPTGTSTAHLPWVIRHGHALTWCLDVCRPVVELQARQDTDGTCRACWDASGVRAA